MKPLLILVVAVLTGASAQAKELIIVTGRAQGSMKRPYMEIAEIAKKEALSQLPHSQFRRVSEWRGSVYAEPRFQTTFVSVEAAFTEANDPGPYFVTVREKPLVTWHAAEIPELIEFSKELVLESAEFYCNSDVVPIEPWAETVKKNARGQGENSVSFHIETSARFQCL